jgi:MATE efflux family protein
VGGALTLALLLIYALLEQFKLPPHLLPQVRSYFILQLISFVVFMASGALKQFFDGIGRTRVPMWIILSSNALNILGNYLLIFGELGAPELGLFGAGLSTLIARVYMLIALVYILHRSRDLRTPYRTFRERGWRTPYIQRLFRLGLPIGVQMGVEAGAWTFAILLITPLGVDALAVHQILVTLTLLGYLIYYGLGAATTILVSRAHSIGDHRQARQTAGIALALAEGTALVVMLGLLVMRHQVGYIFSDDPAVILMTSVAVIPMALYQPGDALQVIYGNALRGMEDVKRMTLYACAIHLILAPSLSYIFGFLLGIEDIGLRLTAIWSSFPISLLLLGIFLYKRFYQITR